MTYNVLFVEVNEGETFHAAQNIHGVHEAALFAGGQIHLCEVAGHHHFRIETLAREHHFHLLRCAVLRFVEDDETVV